MANQKDELISAIVRLSNSIAQPTATGDGWHTPFGGVVRDHSDAMIFIGTALREVARQIGRVADAIGGTPDAAMPGE